MKRIVKLYNKINEFGQLCKGNHLDSHSAAAAFFMFVSIIPFIILILSIVPYTPLTSQNILDIAELLLPKRLDSYAGDIMNQLSSQSLTVLSVSAIAAMWTASRSLLTIKQGLNEILGITETGNFIFKRINAAFYTLILIISFMLILILNVGLAGFERYLASVSGIKLIEKFDFWHIIMRLRPVVTIAIAFLVNLYFFTFLPNKKMKAKKQIPGAVLVSITWYLYSMLFSIYISNYNAYSMYGSLAVVIIVLFWLYACMYILFLGGQFNYYLSLMQENNKI